MDPLQQLLERQAITDVMHRYCRAVDAKDGDGFVAVFAEDGRANFSRHDIVGRDALRAFFDRFIVERMEATQHQVSNIEIDFDGAGSSGGPGSEGPSSEGAPVGMTARSVSYVTAWHRFREPRPDYVVHGQYLDRWGRTAEGWRISERRIAILGEVSQPKG